MHLSYVSKSSNESYLNLDYNLPSCFFSIICYNLCVRFTLSLSRKTHLMKLNYREELEI